MRGIGLYHFLALQPKSKFPNRYEVTIDGLSGETSVGRIKLKPQLLPAPSTLTVEPNEPVGTEPKHQHIFSGSPIAELDL
jgi:hypothetical protein